MSPARGSTGRLLAVALAALLPGVLAPSEGRAQSLLDIGAQPAFVPREVAVARQVRIWADPGLPAESAGIRGVSALQIRRDLVRALGADPRYRVLPDATAETRFQTGGDPVTASMDVLARQSGKLGIEYYRGYNLHSAVDQLREAYDLFERTPARWAEPDVGAELLQYLALSHLELARIEPERGVEHETAALVAMKAMIRLSPGRALKEGDHPPVVVETYRRAWLEHIYREGQELRMTEREAATLSSLIGVEQIVYAFFVVGSTGPAFHLQVWDAHTGGFLLDERLTAWTDARSLRDAIGASLSRALACQTLVAPPPIEGPAPDAGRFYLTSMGTSALFLETPSRRTYFSWGASLLGEYHLTDHFGLFGQTRYLVGGEDPDGDLLRRVNTLSGGLGTVFAVRLSDFRLSGRAGVDLLYATPITATRAFWCKVSGGDPVVFDPSDPTRRCDTEDVVELPGQVMTGGSFAIGGAWNFVGPLWWNLEMDFRMYVSPLEDRPIDLPIGLSTGVGYRF